MVELLSVFCRCQPCRLTSSCGFEAVMVVGQTKGLAHAALYGFLNHEAYSPLQGPETMMSAPISRIACTPPA